MVKGMKCSKCKCTKCKCNSQKGGKEEEDKTTKEEEDKTTKEEEEEKTTKEKTTKSKSGKARNPYDLSSNFETVVYDDKKYQHDLKTKDILKKGKNIGEYVGDKIIFNEVDGEDSSSDEENDGYTSSEEDIRDEIDSVKKDVDNIKYRKHKLKLVCMNEITPKIYDETFRGWGFTFWH